MGIDSDQRVAPGKSLAVFPVRHGAPVIQQPRRAEQERPRADRGDASGGSGPLAHPADKLVVGRRAPHALTACHDKRIHRHRRSGEWSGAKA